MRLTATLLTVALAACGGDEVIGPGDGDGDLPGDGDGDGDLPGDGDGDGDNRVGCTGLAEQPAQSEWVIASGGLDRSAQVRVPPGYDPEVATPVVLNFHGFSSNAGQQQFFSEMNDAADAAGFIVVYPEGTGLQQSWNAGACCGTAASNGVDDVAFVGDLLDELGRRLCVDDRRVYSTGYSNGGFLSNRLACELSDRIAGIAPVAGVIGIPECNPGRPIPVIHFHGTADTLVPYDGSDTLGFPSVADTIAGWSERNGCSGGLEVVFDQGDTICEAVVGCPADGPITLCTVDQGGHTWPGGPPIPILGKNTTEISATDAMWEFLSVHAAP